MHYDISVYLFFVNYAYKIEICNFIEKKKNLLKMQCLSRSTFGVIIGILNILIYIYVYKEYVYTISLNNY